MTVNFSGGQPRNFERVEADGSHEAFSTVSGLTNEIKIATVRSGNTGGFTTGDLVNGNGIDGQVMRITDGGSTVINPWVGLPGSGNGLIRGSLYVDRTGVYGGDLIVATTGGEIWRVTASGASTKIDDVNTHLEGLLVVSDDVATYGPLAGKIIAGAENAGLMYVFDNGGFIETRAVGVRIEDIDLVPENENFFGVNFGTNRLLRSAASDWDDFEGDILLTQEFGGSRRP